jgi:hypothetical protein
MLYTTFGLKKKILEMYPEVREQNFSVGVEFSREKNAYIVTFTRGKESLSTHLEKKDADECMNGIKCVHLGIQVAQFIRNFSEREAFTATAA